MDHLLTIQESGKQYKTLEGLADAVRLLEDNEKDSRFTGVGNTKETYTQSAEYSPEADKRKPLLASPPKAFVRAVSESGQKTNLSNGTKDLVLPLENLSSTTGTGGTRHQEVAADKQCSAKDGRRHNRWGIKNSSTFDDYAEEKYSSIPEAGSISVDQETDINNAQR